ncbi:MAG: leucyl/phenylalanyl-tRNA--protein transferase [Acidiferrobacterales bacterium]
MAILMPNISKVRFPPPEMASPEGLLAVGGDLSSESLLEAYRCGVFPWYSAGQPVLWWSPDPRTVLYPKNIRISRSLRKTLRNRKFRITLDTAFSAVIDACAAPRRNRPDDGTWITDAMRAAYCRLHEDGYAHSIEIWHSQDLVGGLYGVSLGTAFFGESMFSRCTDASKVALVHLVRQVEAWGFSMIDCQVASAHLFSLGAEEIPRTEFLIHLRTALRTPGRIGPWRFDTPAQAIGS